MPGSTWILPGGSRRRLPGESPVRERRPLHGGARLRMHADEGRRLRPLCAAWCRLRQYELGRVYCDERGRLPSKRRLSVGGGLRRPAGPGLRCGRRCRLPAEPRLHRERSMFRRIGQVQSHGRRRLLQEPRLPSGRLLLGEWRGLHRALRRPASEEGPPQSRFSGATATLIGAASTTGPIGTRVLSSRVAGRPRPVCASTGTEPVPSTRRRDATIPNTELRIQIKATLRCADGSCPRPW